MRAAFSVPAPPSARRVPIARDPVDLRRIASLLADAITDPRPFDPYRLDARDPETVRTLLPLFERIAQRYLRARIEGIEHVTRKPALYVGNHNGGILGPDLFCTMAMLWRRLGPDTPLFAMVHDLAMERVTPLGRALARVGGLRAHPSNARRALRSGAPVLAYPGGEAEAYRPFWRRDRIVLPRAGFVRVARDTGVPIVPIVAQGAHRSAIFVHEGEWLARALGLPSFCRIERFPIAFGLPWGLAAGPWVPYLPLPLEVRIRVLPPVRVPARANVETVRRRVVEAMQSALDALAARR